MLDSVPSPEQASGGRLPPPLGAHVSVRGGIGRAPQRARLVGGDALQVFTASPRRWSFAAVSEQEAETFRRAVRENGIRATAAHDAYVINLATPVEELFERSVRAFRAELERCVRLGIDLLVTHPGSPGSADRRAAARRNASAVAGALESAGGETVVLFETTAGGGSTLGGRFEEVRELLEAVPPSLRGRVGVCLDTAHVFAAGYDLHGDCAGVVQEFDRVVGLDRLGLLHVNDSKSALGSRRDRHAGIGEGRIGPRAFEILMSDARLHAIPRIIETPKGGDPERADARNLNVLRDMWVAGA